MVPSTQITVGKLFCVFGILAEYLTVVKTYLMSKNLDICVLKIYLISNFFSANKDNVMPQVVFPQVSAISTLSHLHILLIILPLFSLIAPKASAEAACIISKMGYCDGMWLVTVVLVCVVTAVLLIWLLMEVWLVTVVCVVSNDGALPLVTVVL